MIAAIARRPAKPAPLDEMGEIIRQMDELATEMQASTLELTKIHERLCGHVVELAMVRKDMLSDLDREIASSARGKPVDPDQVPPCEGFTIVEAIRAAHPLRDLFADRPGDPADFRTEYWCPSRRTCSCPPGAADANCPGRQWVDELRRKL